MNIKAHLKSRHFNTGLHLAWLDVDVATFPLWNLSGKLLGYQLYRPDGEKKAFNDPKNGKYYTYTIKQERGVWGLESWYLSNTLYITEGVFDAAKLTWYGKSAIAMLSNDPGKTLRNWLWTVSKIRPVVAVCDGDRAGRKLARYGNLFHEMPYGTDLGDASPEYVKTLTEKYG